MRGNVRNVFRNVFGRHRWGDDIKMNIKEVGQ